MRHAKFNVTQGKNFDSSGAMGPWLVPFRDHAQITDVHLTTRVNGEVRQDDRTGRMMFPGRPADRLYLDFHDAGARRYHRHPARPTGAGARFDPPKYLKPGDEIEGRGGRHRHSEERRGGREMTLSEAEIEQAAEELFSADENRSQIGLLTIRHPKMTLDDAYAVQTALVRRKRAAGRKVIGWKIGLTSKAMQSALNIDIPDSGVLLDDMAFENGATVPTGRFIQPRIEAEIAFVMKAPLAGKDVTREDVIAATDYVAPSLEILDTRILRADPETGQTRKIGDTISDNAANAGIVLGEERHASMRFDLRWIGANRLAQWRSGGNRPRRGACSTIP